MTRTRKLILPAAIVAGAIALGVGCTSHEEISQTMPPYASISDEARDPASAPSPAANSNAGDSGGVMSTIGDVITWPFRALGDAFATK
jgi:hypothetical protein